MTSSWNLLAAKCARKLYFSGVYLLGKLTAPLFQWSPEIRKITYTTNAIESLNMTMRKYTRNRRIFPNDDAAMKALFLAIREASRRWKAIHHWRPALDEFQIAFGDERVPLIAT